MNRVLKFLGVSIFALFFVVLFSQPSFAMGESSRSKNKLGVYASLLSDPYPSLWGINVGYNFVDFIRVTAAYGSLSAAGVTVTAGNAGLKAFVPGWNFSPMVGANYSLVSTNANVINFGSINVVAPAGTNFNTMSISMGFDWQADGGFMLGGAYTLPIGNSIWASTGLIGIHLGYFFM